MAAKRSAKTSGTGGASADGDAGEAAAPARRGKAGIPAGAVAVAVAPEGDEPGEGKGKGPTLRLGDLVSRVAATTGSKKKDTRAAVEATLAEIGGAIARGEDLVLPGVGRVRVVRSAEKGGVSVATLKVRWSGHGLPADEGLAEPVEAD